jgi:hypothetical protein
VRRSSLVQVEASRRFQTQHPQWNCGPGPIGQLAKEDCDRTRSPGSTSTFACSGPASETCHLLRCCVFYWTLPNLCRLELPSQWILVSISGSFLSPFSQVPRVLSSSFATETFQPLSLLLVHPRQGGFVRRDSRCTVCLQACWASRRQTLEKAVSRFSWARRNHWKSEIVN